MFCHVRTLSVLLLTAAAQLPAQAHIGYGGRDFGDFSGLSQASASITNQAVTGNFGWADATDEDFGDSHKTRAFRFHLDNEALVTISAEAWANATATSIGGLLPGFSVYSGLAHVSPVKADHDGSAASLAYLASLSGVPKEGAFRALTDWRIANNDGLFSQFSFQGYAVDGSTANFGDLSGAVGDGVADGKVSGTFRLAAGDYTVFIGGADYSAQNLASASSAYGLKATLSVSPVPEAEALLMSLAGLGLVGLTWHRRRMA